MTGAMLPIQLVLKESVATSVAASEDWDALYSWETDDCDFPLLR
jgi:hypothetical protein